MILHPTASQIELETKQREIDTRLERMSFGQFRMRPDGLYFGDDDKSVKITGLFEVLGRARDTAGDDWARWMRFRDADGRQHQVVVKDADLHGDPRALAATLARQGLMVSVRHRRQLVDYLNGIDSAQRVTTVARTGWHKISEQPVFVLPAESFGKPANEIVVLNDTETSPYSERGTLADWQNGIGRLCAGQRLGVLAVSVAFAGPLLDIANQDGGGIHYRGPSSTGKTSHLRCAASVWGPPTFMRSWRATANALEATAEQHTDTLLALDELNAGTAKEVYAAAYQLAAGMGKGRSHRDGSARKPKTWRVMFISSGEVSLTAKLAEDSHGSRAKAGQEVRLLDIEADVGTGGGAFDSPGFERDAASLAEAIRNAAGKAYGTAGPAFVKALIDNGIEQTISMVADLVDSFCRKTAALGTDGQVRRAAQRLALVAAAGEMAREFGIVSHWRDGEATAAAEFALRQWIANRGGGEAAEALAAVQQVRLFIEKYGTSRFEDVDNPTSIITNRAGWRRGHGEDQVWMVPPEVWKSEVCSGLDPKLVAQVLADRHMLVRVEDGYQKVHKISGRSVRCYTISTRILSVRFVEMHDDGLETQEFLKRQPFRPGTLSTEDDIAFVESGSFK